MAEGGFRLPGASYEDLVKIVVAYGTRDEASNPGDVRKLDAVHRSSASRTNGFLVDIGVLRGEREKLVTRRGRELGLALFHRDEEEVRSLWRRIISTSEFLQNVVSAVKMQEGVSYEAVQAYIAHAAGQPRNKPVMIGSSTIVEILKAADCLREEENGRIFVLHEHLPKTLAAATLDAPEEPIAGASAEEQEPDATDDAPATDFTAAPQTRVRSLFPAENVPDTVVNVHLHVNCGLEDLEDAAPKILALISSLKSSSVDEFSLHFDPDEFSG